MRKMRYTVIIALLLVLIFPVLTVSAESEEIDWSTVDWEIYDFDNFDGEGYETLYLSAYEWLEKEADIETLMIFGKRTDGWLATDFGYIMRYRFLRTPEECLIALEDTDSTFHEFVIRELCDTALYKDELTDFITVLKNVRLDQKAYPQAVGFLNEIIAGTEERLGTDISNPKTGDITLWPLLGLLLGAAGLVLTKRKLAPLGVNP